MSSTAERHLIYIVGPSGAGKDTVIQLARDRCPRDAPITFAHRYITRPPTASGENHVYLNDNEFDRRCAHGCFAMNWSANGHRYGIGVEIDAWLEQGLEVVVSGSREYLPVVRARYPKLRVVAVVATQEKLEDRLKRRGRENAEAVSNRLTRAARYALSASQVDYEIWNDSAPDIAGEALIKVLLSDQMIDRSRNCRI